MTNTYIKSLEAENEELRERLAEHETIVQEHIKWKPVWILNFHVDKKNVHCVYSNGYHEFAYISTSQQWDMTTPENDRKSKTTYQVGLGDFTKEYSPSFIQSPENHYNNYDSLQEAKAAAEKYIKGKLFK